jgi:methylmalonyl-CoA mutase N-terminal domain/subunit
LFEEIRAVGGVVAGLEAGWFQQNRRIGDAAAVGDRQHRRAIVGVNEFVTNSRAQHPTLKVGMTPSGRSASEWRRCVRSAMALPVNNRSTGCAWRPEGARTYFPSSSSVRGSTALYEIRAALETSLARTGAGILLARPRLLATQLKSAGLASTWPRTITSRDTNAANETNCHE